MNVPSSDPFERAAAEQRKATEPHSSVWVSASAGTGKTKVLTDRVLSLMLHGTPPARILCLTFTKAAAAEMANRIAERLEKWASTDDEALRSDIKDLTGAWPDEDRRRSARQLFARVLDAPGGMKIQTIHAFCQALLKRFPLEARVAPHFEVLDERSAAELMLDAREEVLDRCRSGAAAAGLGEALAGVTRHTTEEEFAELMRMLAAERPRLARLLQRHDGVDGLASALARRFGLDLDEDAESVLREACADAALDLMGLRLAADALSKGSEASDRPRGAAIAAFLASPPDLRVNAFDEYSRAFLTAQGLPRVNLITRAAEAAGAEIILAAEAERLLAVRERRNAAIILAATASLLRLGDAMLDAYRRHKDARALLDYDDLVLAVRDLLRREGTAPWVLFKLDGGLDHILIDEAQDTNPEQWEVVAALAAEFFAGEGARPDVRTVFAVGDPKQSIFSFQRADPDAFARMRRHFKARAEAARGILTDVPLAISFRSAPAVLQAVNSIFARPEAQDGLGIDGVWPEHEAARVGQAGLVELWPPVGPHDLPEPEPWALPTTRRGGDSPRSRLARLIAARIAAMLSRGDVLPSRNRAVQPGDIMVLVRRRDSFVDDLVRELKNRGVAVAGVDRMVLTDQLAIMDLTVLGQFLLLSEDDLGLATVLKGPLIGFEEDELFDLARGRGERSLWSELRRRAAERAAFRRAHSFLTELLSRADYTPPYELYADVLGRMGGRRALLGRLGPEAADPIDEFLNLTLAFEREHVPSLQGFLHWLAAGGVEVKRDLDRGSRGQVRVMTVHGAKGLQAPIVFLPDTMQTPRHAARLLWLDESGPRELPIWSPRVGFDEGRAQAARARRQDKEMREHRRLLYVALTRAEDRLYVCGWHGKAKPPGDCWYHLVEAGLVKLGAPFQFDSRPELGADGWQGQARRLVGEQTAAPASEEERIESSAIEPALPDWLTRAPLPEAPGAKPLAPSRLPSAERPVRPPIGDDAGAGVRRGRLIHRLLELLPELPPERRGATCRRFLSYPAHKLAEAVCEEIARETFAILDDESFAPLFGPGSRAEVPIVGVIEGRDGPLAVSGQVDRIVVTGGAVWIVDYKTDRPAPADAQQVAGAYLHQMAAYRAVVSRIYPEKQVRCAILWTDAPRLLALPPDLLDAHAP